MVIQNNEAKLANDASSCRVILLIMCNIDLADESKPLYQPWLAEVGAVITITMKIVRALQKSVFCNVTAICKNA